jgi:S-(hydroxymethyl)glutathione dehydrogenase/alcohol dehydrogenase
VEEGATAVVFGLGGIGLNVIQGLRLAGADMIIGVDINNAKKEWGERFGMTHFVNPTEIGEDVVAHLVNLTKRRGDTIGGARGRTDVPKIVDWYMDGKIEIDPMITHKLPLDRINEAFDLMHRGESIRGVVVY